MLHVVSCFMLMVILFASDVRADPLRSQRATIAALLPLSGEFASQGAAFLQGAGAAIAQAQQEEVFLNHKLVLNAQDTQYLAAPAITAARQSVQDPDLIGAVISTLHEAKPCSSIFEHKKIPAVVLWDSGPEVEALGAHVYGIGPQAKDSGALAARYARSHLQVSSAAILNTSDHWSSSVSTYFKESFIAQGGRVVAHEEASPTESDYRAIILKLIRHHPEALYVPIDNNIQPFFEQLRVLNVTIPVITSDIITNNLLQSDNGPFEAVYQTQPRLLSGASLEYLKKNCGQYCDQLLFVGWGYDGVRALIEAYRLQISKQITMRDALDVVTFDGVTGQGGFNARRSRPSLLSVFQVRKGRLEELTQ